MPGGNPSNPNVPFSPQNSNIKTPGTTHNERVFQVSLKFKPGDVIKYVDSNNQIQYVVQTAPDTFIDVQSRKPITNLGSLIRDLSKPSASVASMSEIQAARNKISGNMLEFNKRRLVIDFETAITEAGRSADANQIFSASMSGYDPKSAGKRIISGDYYVTDVFHDMFSGDSKTSRAARSNYETMSKNVKAGYHRRFLAFAKANKIDIGHTNGMDQLLSNKSGMRRMLQQMDMAQSEYQFKDVNDVITRASSKQGTTAAMGRSTYVHSFMKRVFKFRKDRRYTIGSFNPEGVDEAAMKTLNFFDKKAAVEYDLMDIRGNEMLRNATIFPELVENMHVLNPVASDVAHKLNMTDKQRKVFFEMFDHGISSIYRPGNNAEAMYGTLHEATSTSNYGRAPQSHESIDDTRMHLKQTEMGDEFMRQTQRARMRPELAFRNPKARFISSMVKQMAQRAIHENSTMAPTPEHLRGVTRMVDRVLDVKQIEKQVQSNLESVTSIRLERDILKSNMKQFGGSTVAHLLAGSFMVSGIHHMMNRARRMFSDTKETRKEGMGHESIPTIIRRLELTDFGSPRLGGNPVSAGMKLITQMFRNVVSDPRGIGSMVKKTIGNVNRIINRTSKKSGSYIQMLKNPEQMDKLLDNLFGDNGEIRNLVSNLHADAKISRSTALTIDKNLNRIQDVLSETFGTLKTAKSIGANKVTNRSLEDHLINMFMNRSNQGGRTVLQLKPKVALVAAGGLAAIPIMMSRGNYDPQQMLIQDTSDTDPRRNRIKIRKEKTIERIKNIQKTDTEGLQLTSQERQRLRYTMTDFGSGQRIAKSLINPAKDIAKVMKGYVIRRPTTTMTNAAASVKRFAYGIAKKFVPSRIQDQAKQLTTTYRRSVAAPRMTDDGAASGVKRAIDTDILRRAKQYLIGRKKQDLSMGIQKAEKLTARESKIVSTIQSTDKTHGKFIYTPRNLGIPLKKTTSMPAQGISVYPYKTAPARNASWIHQPEDILHVSKLGTPRGVVPKNKPSLKLERFEYTNDAQRYIRGRENIRDRLLGKGHNHALKRQTLRSSDDISIQQQGINRLNDQSISNLNNTNGLIQTPKQGFANYERIKGSYNFDMNETKFQIDAISNNMVRSKGYGTMRTDRTMSRSIPFYSNAFRDPNKNIGIPVFADNLAIPGR